MKKIIVGVIGVVALIGIVYSSFYMFLWYKDNSKTDSQIKNIQDIASVEEIEDTNDVVVENSDSAYSEYKFLSVDFSSLLKINKEIVGWISIPGTKIDYPFVQHNDNSYYLKHSIDHSYNNAGWVFLDYRNSINDLDNNTIIYAHGRVDGTMFGSLKNILEDSWLSNKDNFVLRISTLKHNYLFEIFSVYHIKTTSDYLYTSYDDMNIYKDFLRMIKERSMYDFDTSVDSDDKIITLSTCFNSSEKLVVHAKLIKSDKK